MTVAIGSGTRGGLALVLLPMLLAVSVAAAGAEPILLGDHRSLGTFANTWMVDGSGAQTDQSTDTQYALPSSPYGALVTSSTAIAGSPTSGPMVKGIAVATQVSTLTPSLFTATGEASVELDAGSESAFGTVIGVSTFAITFELSAPHHFALEGFVGGSSPGNLASIVLGQVLPGPTPPFATIVSYSSTEGLDVTQQGLLSPGIYRLSAEARGQASNAGSGLLHGQGRFRLGFALSEQTTAVGEPSAVVLLAVGTVVAGLRRAFRRRP